MNSRIKNLCWISLSSAVILSGCAYTTAHVSLAYVPEAAKKSPLRTIKPMVFALQVEDQRDVRGGGWVGHKRSGFGAVTAEVKSNKEVTTILHDALRNELSSNGHRVVHTEEAEQAPSDVLIHVGLNKYWSDVRIRFWDIEMIGTINADITIRSPRSNSILFSRPINSTFRESRQIATDKAYESVLNGALAEFIRSFSRDPSILKALRQAEREKESKASTEGKR